MFLTDAELRRLTGSTRTSRQSEWLSERNIPHDINAANEVVLLEKSVELYFNATKYQQHANGSALNLEALHGAQTKTQ